MRPSALVRGPVRLVAATPTAAALQRSKAQVRQFRPARLTRPASRFFPLVLVASLLASPAAGAAENCPELYRQHLASDLQLAYREFDQTDGRGFRALAEKGCDKEAADLIEAYIHATGATQVCLRWHIAQSRASAGQTQAAITIETMKPSTPDAHTNRQEPQQSGPCHPMEMP